VLYLVNSKTFEREKVQTILTAHSDVLSADVRLPHASRPLHLTHVVVGVSVRGADGADDALALPGADAVGDALLRHGARLAEGAAQQVALVQTWKEEEERRMLMLCPLQYTSNVRR
jgi:hypothetical protein